MELDSNGTRVATAIVPLGPKGLVQTAVAALFPGIDAAGLGSFTLQATHAADTLFAYGPIVDNASGDPVFAGR
ncbi:MAG TPA: hypothetical protein VMS98_09855 [Thermoanaerobaculia bacterium]|nr:hypothetical protein [Thermoanaerobaculia bacterium]